MSNYGALVERFDDWIKKPATGSLAESRRMAEFAVELRNAVAALIESEGPAPVAPPTSSLYNSILDNYRHAEREGLPPFTRPERWLENLRKPMPGAWYYATQAEVDQAIVVLDRLARVRRA